MCIPRLPPEGRDLHCFRAVIAFTGLILACLGGSNMYSSNAVLFLRRWRRGFGVRQVR